MSKDKTLYGKDSIESLDAREHLRLRPGMYIGDTANPNQLLLEVFSNSLDEFNIGHGNEINVSIDTETGECCVEDFAQGFPVNVKRQEDGKTILEASFSVINTSGKYRDDGVYDGSSLGLNGLGGKITTFLSEYLIVTTHRDGQFEKIDFIDGLFNDRTAGSWETDGNPSGTKVIFKPDKRFFTSNITDPAFFDKFFNDICCLCDGLRINFIVDGNAKTISKNGIDDFITDKIKNEIEIIDSRFILERDNLKLGMTFTAASASNIIAYVNYGLTDSGQHISTIKSMITRVFNSWAREKGLISQKEKNLDGSSIQEGMVLACNIISKGVAYDAQTKSRVTKIDISCLDDFAKELEIWLDNNPQDGKNIIEKALIARKAAEAAKKAREAVKNKSKKKDKLFSLPTTLADCWTKDRGKAELLITEGKSAMSGLVAARDSEFQAIYGVRGKMLSVLKTTPAKILANQEINNLIKALGLDCDEKTAKLTYDKDKLRYDKIIACADADYDGYAIENLLFNILWFLCPELVINGHVYSAVPPLYRITTKKNEYIYLRDDAALNGYKKKHDDIQSINRLKGLGEQDSEELSYCLLEPESRNILQLDVNNIEKTDDLFKRLYGKDVKPRVDYLLEHAEEAHIE